MTWRHGSIQEEKNAALHKAKSLAGHKDLALSIFKAMRDLSFAGIRTACGSSE
jgi:hypothetical protein